MRGRDREAEPFKVSSSTKSHACPDIYIIFCCTSQPLYELVAGKLSSSQVECTRENSADFARKVWGPEPVRLGFPGGAFATAMSYNLAVRCLVPDIQL